MDKGFKGAQALAKGLFLIFVIISSASATSVNVSTFSALQSEAASNTNDTIVITSSFNHTSELSINRNVTIMGDGNVITLDAQTGNRHFNIIGGNVTFESLKLINGSSGSGGGSIRVTGGEIFANNVIFENNSTSSSDGGGAIYINAGGTDHYITRSSFYSNSSSGNGGAINISLSNLKIDWSNFTANSSTSGGGAIYINSQQTKIYVDVDLCVFIRNSATRGGAFANSSSGESPSTVDSITIDKSFFYLDTARNGPGGAIYSQSNGVFDVTNSSFLENYSNDKGGAIARFGQSASVLHHSTVVRNRGGNEAGGLYTDKVITLNHTIIYGNTSGGGSESVNCNGNPSAFQSQGYSIIGSGCRNANGHSNDRSGDPGLIITSPPSNHKSPYMGALLDSNYMEASRYYPLTFGGNAFDGGDTDPGPYSSMTDQVFNPRFSDNAVDIGAVEFSGLNTIPTTLDQDTIIDEGDSLEFVAANFPFFDIDTIFSDEFVEIIIHTLPGQGTLLLDNVALVAPDTIVVADINKLKFKQTLPNSGVNTPYAVFEFSVVDGLGAVSDTATWTINVNPVFGQPTASDVTIDINEEEVFDFDTTSLIYTVDASTALETISFTAPATNPGTFFSDLDDDNEVDPGEEVTLPASFTLDQFDSLKYQPALNDANSPYVEFTYTVSDDQGHVSTAANFTINVLGVNDNPVGANDTITVVEDSLQIIGASNFTFSDIEDGSTITGIRIVALAGSGSLFNGAIELTAGNTIVAVADSLKYQTAPNGTSPDSFTFRVIDSEGGESDSIYTMIVLVTPVNDLPIGGDESISVDEDSTYAFASTDFPTFNDIEDGTGITGIVVVSLPGLGTLEENSASVSNGDTIENITNLEYITLANDTNDTQFSFRVLDSENGASDSIYIMSVIVGSENDLPTGGNDTVTVIEDTRYEFVQGNFTFSDIEDGTTVTGIVVVTIPTHGVLENNSIPITSGLTTVGDVSLLDYVPAANDTTDRTFTFRVIDKDNGISESIYTMTLNLVSDNDAPTGGNDTVSVIEDITYDFVQGDFTFSDVEDGNAITGIIVVTRPSVGSLVNDGTPITSNGISVSDVTLLDYVPVANDTTDQSFTFRVVDKNGLSSSAVYTMTLDLISVNDIPTGANGTITVEEDATYNFDASDFVFSDVEDGNTIKRIFIVSLPSVGTLVDNGSDITADSVVVSDITQLDYVTLANDTNDTQFSFRVLDDNDSLSVQTYTMDIIVTFTNDLPSGTNDSIFVDEDAVYNFSVTDFPGFSDVEDGTTITGLIVETLPSTGRLLNGGVDIVSNSTPVPHVDSLDFVTLANDTSDTQFTFRVVDKDGGISVNTYTMDIIVGSTNDLPFGGNDTVQVNEDVTYDFNLNDFTFVDIEDGSTVTGLVIMTRPTAGTLVNNGSFITTDSVVVNNADLLNYVPASNDTTDRSFTFRVVDKDGGASDSIYTMTLDLIPVNDLPTGGDTTVIVTEDVDYTFSATDFIFSDVEDSDITRILITDLPEFGALIDTGYTITAFDAALGYIVSDVSNLVFDPFQDDELDRSFQFRILDTGDSLSTDTYIMTLDIQPVNDTPTSEDVVAFMIEDGSHVFAADSFAYADVDLTDTDLHSIVIKSLPDPSKGTFTYNGGTVSIGQIINAADIDLLFYQPNSDQFNPPSGYYDFFTFTVRDDEPVESDSIYTFNLSVTATNDAPESRDEDFDVNEDESITFQSTDFFFDDREDTELFQLRVYGLPDTSRGVFEFQGNPVTADTLLIPSADISDLVYITPADSNGTAFTTFKFQVQDHELEFSMEQTATINILPVNDAPVHSDLVVTIPEDDARIFNITNILYTDIENDDIDSVYLSDTTSNVDGYFFLSLNGNTILDGAEDTLSLPITLSATQFSTLIFRPYPNESGSQYREVKFNIKDDGGDWAVTPRLLTIHVTSINDAPESANFADTINEDSFKQFSALDFAFNDVDVDDTDLHSIVITRLPNGSDGTFELSGNPVALNDVILAANISSLFYTPNANQFGNDYATFEFKVRDDELQESANDYTFTLHVTPVNDLPVISNDVIVNIQEEEIHPLSISGITFTDIEGEAIDSIRLADSTVSLGGTFYTDVNANGTYEAGTDLEFAITNTYAVVDTVAFNDLIFVPAENEFGSPYREFKFQIKDTGGDWSTVARLYTINVSSVNDVPVVTSDVIVTIVEDSLHSFDSDLINFTDTEGDAIVAVRIADSSVVDGKIYLDVNLNRIFDNGVDTEVSIGSSYSIFSINGFDSLIFVPDTNESASPYRELKFQVQDQNGGWSELPYVYQINVTPVNDNPFGASFPVTIDEDTQHTFAINEFTFTDVDDTQLASINVITIPDTSLGLLTLSGDTVDAGDNIVRTDIPNLVYTPKENRNGTPYTSFTFTVLDDDNAASVSYTVTINVNSVNDLPTSANDTVQVTEDIRYEFLVSDFDFEDVEDDDITGLIIVTLPAQGALVENTEDTISTVLDTVFDISVLNYDPLPNDTIEQSFQFRVLDSDGGESVNTYTMVIRIQGTTDAPTSANGIVSVIEDTDFTFNDSNFVFNDVEDGTNMTSLVVVTVPSRGYLINGVDTLEAGDEVSDPNVLIYSPQENDDVNNAFTFRVKDSGGSESVQTYTMTLDIIPVNDLPLSNDDVITLVEDTPESFEVSDFDFIDVEDNLDGVALDSIVVVTRPTTGALVYNGDTVDTDNFGVSLITLLEYVPEPDDFAGSSFTFRVVDSEPAASDSAYTMVLSIQQVNDLPITRDTSITIGEDSVYVFVGFPFNDPDSLDGDSLTAVEISVDVSNGLLEYFGNDVTAPLLIPSDSIGQLTYTPTEDLFGTPFNSFEFRVQDKDGNFSIGTNTFTINVVGDPFDDAPYSRDTIVYIQEDELFNIAKGYFYFIDPDSLFNDSLTQVRIDSLPGEGTFLYNGSAISEDDIITDFTLLTYQPTQDLFDTVFASFRFTVFDKDLNASDSSYLFEIAVAGNGNDDAPYSRDTIVYINEDELFNIAKGYFYFVDPDSLFDDSLTQVRIGDLPDEGTFIYDGNNVGTGTIVTDFDLLTYQPTQDLFDTVFASFTFTVFDKNLNESASDYLFEIAVAGNGNDDPPSSLDTIVYIGEDSLYTFVKGDFHFIDPDSLFGDDLKQVRIDTIPSVGNFIYDGNPVTNGTIITDYSLLTYQPEQDQFDTVYAYFKFRVFDKDDHISASDYLFEFAVEGDDSDDIPWTQDFVQTIAEDTYYQFEADSIPFFDPDTALGDTLSAIQIVSDALHGRLEYFGNVINSFVIDVPVDSLNQLVYIPDTNEYGTPFDTIPFKVYDKDAHISVVTGNLVINVEPVFDFPVSNDTLVYIREDGYYEFTYADFPFFDADADVPYDLQVRGFSGRVNEGGVLYKELNGDSTQSGALETSYALLDGLTEWATTGGNVTMAFFPDPDEWALPYFQFQFRVRDSDTLRNSWSDWHVMTIDVTESNDLPTGGNDSILALEDVLYNFEGTDFTFSDKEDGDTAQTIRIISYTGGDTLFYQGNAFNPATDTIVDILITDLSFKTVENQNGNNYSQFEFRYKDLDLEYSDSSYTMTIHVLPVNNDLPSGGDDIVQIPEDDPYTFSVADFTFNDVDAGDVLSKLIITQLPDALNGAFTENGTVVSLNDTIENISTLVYDPVDNMYGVDYDSFRFRVLDQHDSASVSDYRMQIDVLPDSTDDVPVTRDTVVTIMEDEVYSFTDNSFPYFDADPADSSITAIRVITLPSEGELRLNGTLVTASSTVNITNISQLTYTPEENMFSIPPGSVYTQFNFKVVDSHDSVSTTQTFSFIVEPIDSDDAPFSIDTTITIAEDSIRVFKIADFKFIDPDSVSFNLGNAYDSLVADTMTQISIESIAGRGTFRYTGTDVAVTPIIISVGTIGDLEFQPFTNEFSNNYASFRFKVYDKDGHASDSSYLFTINVTPVNNDIPVTRNDTIELDEDSVYDSFVTDAVFSFTDPDAGAFQKGVVITDVPDQGALKISDKVNDIVNGELIPMTDLAKLIYTPELTEYGNPYTSFDFRVMDNTDSVSAIHTITVIVNPVNDDAPVTQDFKDTIVEDTELPLTLDMFPFTDPDETEGDKISAIKIVSQSYGNPNSGLFKKVLDVNNQLTLVPVQNGDTLSDLTDVAYIPAKDYYTIGLDEIIGFQVLDSYGLISNAAIWSIHVLPDNIDAPQGINESITMFEDTTAEITQDSIQNFIDVDGDKLKGLLVEGLPKNGTLVRVTSGIEELMAVGDTIDFTSSSEYVYTPDSNKVGAPLDSIDFRYIDDRNTVSENIYILWINVINVNDPPHDVTITQGNFDENEYGKIKVGTINVFDIDDSTFTFELFHDNFEVDENGDVYLKETKSYDYETTPLDSFQIVVRDGGNPALEYSEIVVVNIGDVYESSDLTITKIIEKVTLTETPDSKLDTIYTSHETVNIEYQITTDFGKDSTTTVNESALITFNGVNVDSTIVIQGQNPTINSNGSDTIVVKYNVTPVEIDIIWKDEIVSQDTVFYNQDSITVQYKVTTPDKTGKLVELNLEATFPLERKLNGPLSVTYTNIYGVTGTQYFHVDMNNIAPEVTLIYPSKDEKVNTVIHDLIWRIVPQVGENNLIYDKYDIIVIDTLVTGENTVTYIVTDKHGNTGIGKDVISVGLDKFNEKLITPITEHDENKLRTITLDTNEISVRILDGEQSTNNDYIWVDTRELDGSNLDYLCDATLSISDGADQEIIDLLLDSGVVVTGTTDSTYMQEVQKAINELLSRDKTFDDVAIEADLKSQEYSSFEIYVSVNVPQLVQNRNACNWKMEVTNYIEVFDQIGQFVNRYEFTSPAITAERFNIDGSLKFVVSLNPTTVEGFLTYNGRKWGKGAYILRHSYRVDAVPGEDFLINDKRPQRVRKTGQRTFKVGYLRDEN